MLGTHLCICVIGAWLTLVTCRPPVKNVPIAPPAPPPSQKGAEMDDLLSLEYQRYLHEVVSHLESDPEFKKKLETADPEYIKSGKIADHLEHVPYEIRTKLDEAKNKEIERLRELIKRQVELDGPNNIKLPEHIDHMNLENFGKDDLRKLIVKTTKDLDDIDQKRKGEFKEYEERKEAEWRHYLSTLTEEGRAKAIADHAALMAKHKKHPDLKHPGSEDQLKEEDDPFEREEEMNRMREHVVKEMDKNKDHFISMDEFIQDTKDPQFDNKESWDTLDEQDQYTEEELRQYEKDLAMKNGWGTPDYVPGQHYPTYHPPGYDPNAHQQQQQQQQHQINNNEVHGGQLQMQQQGHLGHEVPVGQQADQLLHNDNTVNHKQAQEDVVKQQQEIRKQQHLEQANVEAHAQAQAQHAQAQVNHGQAQAQHAQAQAQVHHAQAQAQHAQPPVQHAQPPVQHAQQPPVHH